MVDLCRLPLKSESSHEEKSNLFTRARIFRENRIHWFFKVWRFWHKQRDKNQINRQKFFLLGLAVSHPRSRDTNWQEDNLCHRRLGKEKLKWLEFVLINDHRVPTGHRYTRQ